MSPSWPSWSSRAARRAASACASRATRSPATARGFYGSWRAHLVFEDARTIVVFAVTRHTGSSNPKKAIAEILPEVSAIGVRRSEQPPCCEDFDDPPPPLEQDKVDLIKALL
jgi:hypothetical protein